MCAGTLSAQLTSVRVTGICIVRCPYGRTRMATKVAIIYYSATGTTYRLARAVEEGATEAGADVRLRKVRELAPDEAIASNQGSAAHRLESQHVADEYERTYKIGGDHQNQAVQSNPQGQHSPCFCEYP